MKTITVENLIELIQEYKSGKSIQSKPEIIWFDKVEGDLLKYSTLGNWEDLANSLSKKDEEIALNLQTGSPLTDHENIIDEEKGVVRKITDKERNSFFLPSVIDFDDKGKLLTKVYLHTSPINYHGKKGLTTFQYSKMVHDNLKLPVLLFFPLKWKEKIQDNLEGYEEYLCTDDLEDQKQRWLERVAKKSDEGIQIVDNFYLDFLKQAPNYLLSADFDESSNIIPGINPSYYNWQRLSRDMQRKIKKLLKYLPESDSVNYNSLFQNGNLNFDILHEVLNKIPEENWRKFIENEFFDDKEFEPIMEKGNRDEIFKLYLSTQKGYFPYESSIELLKFHNVI